MQKLMLICEYGIYTFRYLEDASNFVRDLGLDWNTLVDRQQIGWPCGMYS